MNDRMRYINFCCAFLMAGLLIPSGQLMAQEKRELFFADPTVYIHNGKYYLTGTGGSGRSAASGFAALESTNLETWSKPAGTSGPAHMILTKGEQAFGTEGFWAPQLFQA